MSEQQSAKGALVEKIVFAVIPILFTCVVYLLSQLNSIENRVQEVERNAALDRAEIAEKAALARAELAERITVLEYRANNGTD